MKALYGNLLNHIYNRRKAGINQASFMDSVIDEQENGKQNLTRSQLEFLGGVLIEGGTDTSAVTLVTFIQAMTKWREAQKNAQEEIDAVVGDDRSPVWSDYPKLPCVSMIIKEVMRWRPAAPLGFPHCLSQGKFSPVDFQSSSIH
jgi:cytochrome P450